MSKHSNVIARIRKCRYNQWEWESMEELTCYDPLTFIGRNRYGKPVVKRRRKTYPNDKTNQLPF